ncbi:MAG: amino acid adenylation domain-containing protein [Candidatus Aminicenantes bacterium]|jgi:tyrocidine synthetase-3
MNQMAVIKSSSQSAIAAAQHLEEKKYWLSKLAGKRGKCVFPNDYYKRAKHASQLETTNAFFPQTLRAKVIKLSNNSDVRLYVMMVTSLFILLAKYTHLTDITVGTSIYRQDRDETFVNTVLPLRITFNDNMTFKELLMQVAHLVFEANKNQNYPMEKLLELLDIPFFENEDFPLFDIAILMEGLHHRQYLRHIHLNMIYTFKKNDTGIEVNVEYNSALYMKITIERIVSHLINLLENAVFNPDLPLIDIEMMSPREKKEILFGFNDTKAGYSRNKTMHQLFEEQVERTPHYIAVIGPAGVGTRFIASDSLKRCMHLTYEKLNETSNQLARGLRLSGIGPNRLAAVVLDRLPQMVIGVMAILKAGGAYVPLETYLPEARIVTCLASLNAECLLTNFSQLEKINQISKELPDITNIFCLEEISGSEAGLEELSIRKQLTCWEEVGKNSSENLVPAASAADMAYVIFTSGTTGTPKGVVETHRPVINVIQWVNQTFEVTGWDRLLFVVSLGFDLSVYDIFGILAAGAAIRMVAADDLKLPERLLDIILKEGITFWDSAPAALQLMVPYLQEFDYTGQNTNTNTLRLVFLSGDWIPVTMPDILKEYFEGVTVISLGGATEATIWSNYYPINSVNSAWNSIPYGKPIQNAKYYILDRHFSPCPIGVPGDLYIGGECLASGYINDKELSSAKFPDNPFVHGEVMYKTGDLARWFHDGNMEFLGRKDNQVKIRGYRIELGEIECQLLLHEDVTDAVVLAKGEAKGDRYLCAYYVTPEALTAVALSNYLSLTLPDYMIPTYFIKLEQIPLTPNGKVNRKALPEPKIGGETAVYVAPSSEIERKIVEIWAEIINLPKEQIGIQSDFFELGGHSLSAIRMVANIHKNLNVKLSLAEVFAKPTIQALAQSIENSEVDRFVAIEPIEKKEYYTLSSLQKSLYVIQQMEKDNTAYNMPMSLPITGEVDREKLASIFKKLIKRHENLRTSYEIISGEPVQRIQDEVAFNIRCEEADESQVENIIGQFTQPFDLSRVPLLRVGLVNVKTSSPLHVLLLDMHHIITDENSQVLLRREFMELNTGKQLPAVKLQYKDYSHWQNSKVEREAIKKQQIYWLKQFADAPPPLNLPTDYHRPVTQDYEGNIVNFGLSQQETAILNQVAEEEGATVFMVLLAVLNIFLSKLCGQEDIVVGAPIAGRNHDDLEKVIGMFVNTLAIRNYPGGDKTFREFLIEVKIKSLDSFENQEYPFDELVQSLAVERNADRNPLFDVMINLLRAEEYLEDIPGEGIQDSYTHQKGTTKFDLIFLAGNFIDRVYFNVKYRTALFRPETIDRYIGYFRKIISQLPESFDREISSIDMISAKEKRQLLHDFNDFKADYPKDKILVELFEDQVKQTPDAIAIVFEDVRVSYRKLNEQSNQLARLLKKKGAHPDGLVGIMVERSVEMVVGIFGILKAGGAYLPVNPETPPDRISYMFDNASVKICVTHGKYPGNFEISYDIVNLARPDSYKGSVSNPEHVNLPADLAYVIYTSGSTGLPKGVAIEQRSVVNIIKWFAGKYNFKTGFNLIQMFEYTFDASVNQIFGSLLHGATLHIIRKEYFFDIEFLREYMIKHFINLINFVQSVIKELLCGQERLESLKYVISGAEKLRKQVKDEILDLGYALYNQYGPTEATVDALAEQCSYQHNGTIGVPVYNAQCYVLNHYGQLNPIGAVGELYVGGDGLSRGYINNVELTVEKFVLNPFISKGRIYRTGDLTRWLPDGAMEFLGRIDHQVKIRGFRIELGEIENQLLKIDTVKQTVVIDREDRPGDLYLCAYVVLENGNDIDKFQIKQELGKSLPAYMIPGHFVVLDAIPLTGHGKLDRDALPKPEFTATDTYVAPQNLVEEKLVDIWSDVLNIDKDTISIHADFFELGGHSLKATIMNARVYKELQVKLPLAEVFRSPTIRELAEIVKELTPYKFVSIAPVEKREYYALSSAQERLLILYQLAENSTNYNLPSIVTIEKFDITILKNAFYFLIQRHESLRTSLSRVNARPVQKVHDHVEFEIGYHKKNSNNKWSLAINRKGITDSHFSSHTNSSMEEIIKNFVQPFDLSHPPLLRVGLIEIGTGEYILMVDMHHIISDGVSHGILLEDFMKFYNREQLPPLRIHYKDYSQWQHSGEMQEVLKSQEKYWLKKFQGEIPILNLPTDYMRPMVQSFDGQAAYFELTEEETNALNELSRSAAATSFMVLLAVYNVFLSRMSSQEDIVVGTPIAGRNHADLDRVMGMFVNTLVMRNYPAGDKTFEQFLGEIKKRTLQDFENQDYPFEKLVVQAGVIRDVSRNPMFDVVFSFQNIFETNGEVSEQKINGVKIKPHYYENPVSKFDLSLIAVERGNQFYFTFEYCTRLFRKETIDTFIGYFKKIVSSLIETPGQKISGLEIIGEKEKKRILYDFNNTKAGYPQYKVIHWLFEEKVKQIPDHIAVIGPGLGEDTRLIASDSGKQNVHLTYKELDQQSGQLAYLLKERGVQPDIIVGIMVERSLEMITGIWGILKAGGAYVPIDPGYPRDRISYMLADSNAKILLTTPQSQVKVETEKEFIEIIDISHHAASSTLTSTSALDYRVSPPNLSYIIYTSGTSGKPKGVMISHRNVVRLMVNDKFLFDFTCNDIWTMFHSFCFDFSVWEMYGALLYGGQLVIISKTEAQDTFKYLEILKKKSVTIVNQTPSAFYHLMNLELKNHKKELHIKYVIFGGEALAPRRLKEWKNRYPQVKLINMYGITETTVHVTFKEIGGDEIETNISNIGIPIPTLSTYIMDNHLKLLPMGVHAELIVGGDGVARGYLNRPELTAEKFVSNPDKPQEKLYKSGDLAKFSLSGKHELEYLGRIDHQVKIRGFRIELGEIENQLLNHDNIKDAVVLQKEKAIAEKYLCAYIVSDIELSVPELWEYLGKKLPDYMIPAYFVRLEKIPLNPNGKVDRKALPLPKAPLTSSYIAPRDDIEKKLALIWASVLGLKEKIGIDDNFFQLGGHSLNATLLLGRIHKEFNVNIPLVEIFKTPTIKVLASLIKVIHWGGNRKIDVNDNQDREEIVL